LLNSPSNPTGGVASRDALSAVVEWCAERGITWVSDEIYEDFVWDGEHLSPRDLHDDPDAGIVLSGLSKSCAMMGWRLGWLIASEATVEGLKPLHQHLVTCAPTLAQTAAIAAVEHHEAIVAEARALFAERRAVVLDILGEMPKMNLAPPRGAFYAFPDVTPWCDAMGGSVGVCQTILDEADVVTIPGAGFGAFGEGHLRIAYTTDLETLREALGRVVDVLNRYQP
jgi:aspartate aminotransferase